MTDTEYWKNEVVGFLALASIKGVGYWTMRRLSESGIGFKDLLKTSEASQLERLLRVSLAQEVDTWEQYQQQLWEKGLKSAREIGKRYIRLIFKEQTDFPDKLRDIDDAPHWIFVQGNLRVLHQKSVAIVGTRRPSDDGIFLTKYAVAALSNLKLSTISGLASGIDQAAHTESIRYGIPTVAVLGNGIYQDFPKGSEELRETIIKSGGAIVTEYLPHQTYSAENFVRRNRIQAALCDTLIPVEWKIKSGTAHTVEYAYKYRRKIANIFLPKTAALRPELEFSENRRGALSFEVPVSTTSLLNYITEGELAENKVGPAQGSLDI